MLGDRVRRDAELISSGGMPQREKAAMLTSPMIRVRLMLEDFPFLGKIFAERQIVAVTVQRVDEAFLTSPRPCRTQVVWGGYDVIPTAQILFLDKDGNILGQVGARLRWSNPHAKWYTSRWLPSPVTGSKIDVVSIRGMEAETVNDALSRIPAAQRENIRFVVMFSKDRGGNITIVIHRPPRQLTVTQWVEELEQQVAHEATQSLEASRKEIDGDAA